jgi:hypothetical protein
MGLALLDVADAVRPHPDVVAFLQDVDDDGFLDEMAKLAGRLWRGRRRSRGYHRDRQSVEPWGMSFGVRRSLVSSLRR